MKYFGIPTCPYCKKSVNLIRVWRIKKSGEFMCPRCKGISNVYLSPLIYLLAVICISAGFLTYFFDRFIWATTSITSPIKVLVPFLIFFILSLFMVYLKKPIIRKIKKTKDGRYFDQNGNELKMRMGKLIPVSTVIKEAEKFSKENQNPNNYDDLFNFDDIKSINLDENNFDDINKIDFEEKIEDFIQNDDIKLNSIEKIEDIEEIEEIDLKSL
ncbi:MAG: hypothetical protein R3Y35_02845 [Clostridia bacterium]